MAESNYAARLRERGLEELPTSRRDRKRNADRKPQFTIGTQLASGVSITYVTDETGQRWMAMKAVDLADLGFHDASAEVRRILEEIGSIPKAN